MVDAAQSRQRWCTDPRGIADLITTTIAPNSEYLRDIVQDAHLNFLLGAGTSYPLFELLGNVEELLTKLADQPAGPVRHRAVASVYRTFLQSSLRPNEMLFTDDVKAQALVDSYGRFLSTVNQILLRRRSSIINMQANVFTTNFDVAIEVAAERIGIHLNDGFTGRFDPSYSTGNFGTVPFRRSLHYDNLSEIPAANLYKLHGSVSWELKPDAGDGSIALDSGLAQLKRAWVAGEPLAGVLLDVTAQSTVQELMQPALPADFPEAEVAEFIECYSSMSIVNPTKEKFRETVLVQNYYDLLRIFSNELEKENSLLIVAGFSCRDEHFRDLLVRAARTNPTLLILVFAYLDGEVTEIAERFKSYSLPNENIRIVTPGAAASTGEPEPTFSLDDITTNVLSALVPLDSKELGPPKVGVAATAPAPSGTVNSA